MTQLQKVEEALQDLRDGKFIIVVDDEQRENEGDFCLAADFVTPEKINFLTKLARGLICISMPQERLDELELHPMVMNNTSDLETNFTVSVDIKNGGTGISAKDRSDTCKAFVDPNTAPSDLARPGHIFPLGAKDGGVLVRAGHTEAIVDLCKLAGISPVGIICEILSDDGTMARMDELKDLAKEHDVRIVAIKDLIAYRTQKEQLVKRVVTSRIPNEYGMWNMHLYENLLNNEETVVLVMGEPTEQDSALVRVHSKCFTGDTLLSHRCDCGPQLHAAMSRIAEEGHGVIIYMDQEGRGIGLRAKMEAYNLQEKGRDTVDANVELGYKADLREYGIGAQIIRDLGLQKIRIMTNNPKKIVGIKGFGLEVVDRVSLHTPTNKHNERYVKTKIDRMGHLTDDNLFQTSCSNAQIKDTEKTE